MKVLRHIHQPLRLSLMVLMGVFTCFGQGRTLGPQNAGPTKTVEARRPIEIENLVSESRYVPPEFAASLLLRIAQSEKVTDQTWKKELLEEAFRLAEKAQFSVRKKVLPLPGVSVDTSSGYLSYAFDLGLDRLSLKSRVIKAMLRLDRQRARELLLEISPKLPLESLSCSDSMVYQVEDFYEILTQVAREAFSAQEIESGVRAEFLLPYVKALSSPAQVKPVIELLLALKKSPHELSYLVRAFVPAFKNISGDDRSFSYSASRDSIARAIVDLARSGYDSEKQSDEILGAFRSYLLKNLTSTRCRDNAITDVKTLPWYIKEANLIFADQPLLPEEIKELGIGPTAKILNYWETDDARRMLKKIKELSWKGDNEQVSETDMQSLEWQQRVREFLSELEGWEGRHESSALAAFHEKCVLYRGLLTRVGDGSLPETIAASYVQYLSKSAVKEESRIDWFLHVSDLLDQLSADQRNNMLLGLLTRSSDPTIRLNAESKRLRI